MGKIFEKTEQIDLFGYTKQDQISNALNDRFIIPPFSVFDTRKGYWQDRKRVWKSLGIKSEVGRDCRTFRIGFDSTEKPEDETKLSIFDPVICEICYKWFNTIGGKILDPFAGGSVRGIVAEKLGYKYIGFDLRKEQVDANIQNANELGVEPTWICDDSNNLLNYVEKESADLVFTCPPYYDLEVYSDNPNDLSNMSVNDFENTYEQIVEKCCHSLKQNRFAVFVVGDVRDKNGFYLSLTGLTKKCFEKYGVKLYNEIILLTSVGSASMRCAGSFKTRKITKVHQNILVFYKGDPNKIKDNFNEMELDY